MSGRAKQGPARVFIKKGARFFLNDALIQAQDSFNAEIHLADVLLLPSHLIEAGAARTPIQQVYYFVQQMLIEPGRASVWRAAFAESLRAEPLHARRAELGNVEALVAAGHLPDALAQLRRLIKVEPKAA